MDRKETEVQKKPFTFLRIIWKPTAFSDVENSPMHEYERPLKKSLRENPIELR